MLDLLEKQRIRHNQVEQEKEKECQALFQKMQSIETFYTSVK
jgi:hypothetical protein